MVSHLPILAGAEAASRFRLPVIIILCLVLAGCGKTAPEVRHGEPAVSAGKDRYSMEVTLDRKKKDLHFLRDETSPLPSSEKPTFVGLHYFEPDKKFAFLTTLTPAKRRTEITLATSKGRGRLLVHIGELSFVLDGKPLALQVYAPKDTSTDGNYWFIPFTDATTGKESYSGGRYLEFSPPPKDTVALDFNYAYNPYCAYNDRFDCPIPVKENRLPIAITAGEKAYRKSH